MEAGKIRVFSSWLRKRVSGLALLLLLGGLGWAVAGAAPNGARMPFTAPQPAGGDTTFLVYGDVQDNHRDGHTALTARMLQEPADLVFNTGDISPDKGKRYARDFLPDIEEVAQRVPFFPAPGNHDVHWRSPQSREGFRTFFGAAFDYLSELRDNTHLKEDRQKLWYAIVHDGVLFVVLDSNLFIDEGKYRKTNNLERYDGFEREQLLWLYRTFRRYREDDGIRARFVFFHHSPIVSHQTVRPLNLGGHPGHREMLAQLNFEVDSKTVHLLDLFRESRVNAVFSGHEHFYERWQEVIVNGEGEPWHRLNWIVNGMGGVKPRGEPETDPTVLVGLLAEVPGYLDYLSRARRLGQGWKSSLGHAFPKRPGGGRFHNYMKVTVNDLGIHFQTIDVEGKVRDQGEL